MEWDDSTCERLVYVVLGMEAQGLCIPLHTQPLPGFIFSLRNKLTGGVCDSVLDSVTVEVIEWEGAGP